MTEAETKPNRRRGRPSAELSARITDDILEQATAMFLDQGFEAFSMEALATALRIPKTTVYKRFSDKADLLRAAIDKRMSSWSAIRAEEARELEGDDLEGRLAYLVSTMLIWATKPEVRAINRLFANLPQADTGEFNASTLWGYQSMVALMVRSIEELGPMSGIKARDPAGAAELIMAVVAGTVAMRSEANVIQANEAQELAHTLLSHLFRGASGW